MNSVLFGRSVIRRFAVCLLLLAAVDQAVIPILHFSESKHYRSAALGRFPNSDLFPLGPLVDYLEENPAGSKPRVAFLGDSRVWGYQLEAEDAIPAVFQRLAPNVEVLNLGINGFQNGSDYLLSKRLLGSVDSFYLFFHEDPKHQQADPLLPTLIRVDPADAARFGLRPSSKLQIWLGRVAAQWHLARYSYRLQAAWFGTSTRQACALFLKDLMMAHSAQKPVPATNSLKGGTAEGASAAVFYEAPTYSGSVSVEETARLAKRYPFLWNYAGLLARSGRRGFFIEFSTAETVMSKQDAALFNAHFSPYATIVRLTIPDSWFLDKRLHMTREGASGVARLLARMTRELSGEPPK